MMGAAGPAGARRRRGAIGLLPRLWVLGLTALALAACVVPADTRDLGRTSDETSTATIDHGAWDAFLSRYVVDRIHRPNLVRYSEVTPEDKAALDAYVERLQAIPITTYGRDEQIAYWMNLYNATTVKLVLEHWPVESILEIRISPGRKNYGPWGLKMLTVEARELALENIEHHILRDAFADADPNVHYGLTCASMGCPSLMPRAITGADWREQLAANARDYVNSEHGVSFARPGMMEVSKIYHSWYQNDFGGDEKSVIAHLLKYAEGEKAEKIAAAGTISSDFYDWRLNAPEMLEPGE